MPPSHVRRSSYAQPAAHAVADARGRRANCARVSATHASSARAQASVGSRPPSRSVLVGAAGVAAPRAARTAGRSRQSRPKSCQKFVSCSAVHSASDDRSSASSR